MQWRNQDQEMDMAKSVNMPMHRIRPRHDLGANYFYGSALVGWRRRG